MYFHADDYELFMYVGLYYHGIQRVTLCTGCHMPKRPGGTFYVPASTRGGGGHTYSPTPLYMRVWVVVVPIAVLCNVQHKGGPLLNETLT